MLGVDSVVCPEFDLVIYPIVNHTKPSLKWGAHLITPLQEGEYFEGAEGKRSSMQFY